MSRHLISRRRFFGLPLAVLLAPVGAWAARGWATASEERKRTYTAEVGILYGLLTFHLDGALSEAIDRVAGHYRVTVVGEGDGIANRLESRGFLQDGRWAPLEGRSWFSVKGRESRTELRYDWTRRTVEYRFRGETFFLRRSRVAEDLVRVPEGLHVDDSISATLNYADGLWSPRDGALRTFVVRRRQAPDEGPDEVATGYRAELAPLEAKLAPDPENGKSSALFDLSPFSSWMRPSRPARIVFGINRRPELITTSMILGSSVTIRLGAA